MEPLLNSDAVPIRPERLCKEISDILPPNGIVVSDTGYSGIWTGAMINLRHPGQSYIRAAGSLGWGFPASLGVKCGAPERPLGLVVCFTGEGGFFYHLSELETASRCGINTVTVINNNHCLRQCLEGINRAYGDRPGKERRDVYVQGPQLRTDCGRDGVLWHSGGASGRNRRRAGKSSVLGWAGCCRCRDGCELQGAQSLEAARSVMGHDFLLIVRNYKRQRIAISDGPSSFEGFILRIVAAGQFTRVLRSQRRNVLRLYEMLSGTEDRISGDS